MQQSDLYVSCPACGDEESEIHQRMLLLRTLCISVLFTMPLLWGLRPIIQLVLATVVQFWPGMYFYKGAYRALKEKVLGMDFLVALSTTIIYIYSAYTTFTVFSNVKLYFMSECVLLSLILFGKYMETTSRYEASSAIRKLISLRPDTTCVLRGDEEITAKLDEILPSDIAVVHAGDHIPIDGRIEKGECLVDESMLTGESELIKKYVGDMLYCGTVCREGSAYISCEDIGKASMLQQIIGIVGNAQREKAPIARLTDKIATVFVPVVTVISAAVFCLWYFALAKSDLAQAVSCVCATLVIACPCALGLATPTAIMTGSGKAAGQGILFRGGEQLETAHKIDTVIFDKTGTLTTGCAGETEHLRSGAAETVSCLKKSGIEVWMITGDKENKAKHIARLVGIDNVVWGVLPADKAEAVKQLRRQGKRVAMVGDGINDSPALVCADIGIALGTGTDIAIDSADVMIAGGSITAVPRVFELSGATMKTIRQNLIWAVVYNVICIPLAAMGIINPSIAAAAMSLSSNGVLLNSLRLK